MRPIDRFYARCARLNAEWLIEQERAKWAAVIVRLLQRIHELERERRAA